MQGNRLFVFSGASGVGKSTVLKEVMKARPELIFSVSATTRQPREGEVEGKSYYFVSEQAFEQMIDRGEFLEYDRHNNCYYGTPWPQLAEKLEKGPAVLDIEPNGAFNVKSIRPDAVLIFIMPPSWEVLEQRLRGRGDTDEEQIDMRLNRARWEMKQRNKYDYVVVNDVLETCVNEILNIIDKNTDEDNIGGNENAVPPRS